MKIKKITALVALLISSALTHAAVTVGTFNGSAIGSGLDLNGNFVYAVTMNSNVAGTVVGDANFTSAFSTSGIAVSNLHFIQDWYPTTYTGSAADIALGGVMRSIIWSDANGSVDSQVVTMTMSALTIGRSYQAQFMFAEHCCNRGFNFYQDGIKMASDFSPYSLTGGTIYNSSQSAVLNDNFTATATSVVFGFGGQSSSHSDNNPILNAATLEDVSVPEPDTYAMLLTGLGLMGFTLHRRKTS